MGCSGLPIPLGLVGPCSMGTEKDMGCIPGTSQGHGDIPKPDAEFGDTRTQQEAAVRVKLTGFQCWEHLRWLRNSSRSSPGFPLLCETDRGIINPHTDKWV